MKKLLHKGLLLLATGLLFVGCADDPLDPLDVRDNYLGTWNVFEESTWQGVQSYEVEIVAGDSEDEFIIRGLYNVSATRVYAIVDEYRFTLPNQTSEGFQFWGSGTANADFDQLNISFQANDGSYVDSLQATLTR